MDSVQKLIHIDLEDERVVEQLVGGAALVAVVVIPILVYKLIRAILRGICGVWAKLTARKPTKPSNAEAEDAVPSKGKKEKKEKKEKEKPADEGPRKIPVRTPTTADPSHIIKAFKRPEVFVARSPGGKFVFLGSGADRSYRIYDGRTIGTKNDFRQLMIDKATATCAAFDPTEEYLALYVENLDCIKVFGITDVFGTTSKNIAHESYTVPVAKGADICEMGMGPGGRFVVYCNTAGHITVQNHTGEVRCSTDAMQGKVNKWAFSPDGNLLGLAAGMSTSRLYHIDSKGGQFFRLPHVITLNEHKLNTTGIAFSPSRTHTPLAATMSKDGRINIWDIGVKYEISTQMSENAKLLVNFEDTDVEYFTRAAFSYDNKFLALSRDDTIVIFNIDGGMVKLVGEITYAHKNCDIKDLLFVSPNQLMSIAEGDSKVKLWDIPKGVPPPKLKK
eukprot:Sspe_Gene.81885::Locus_53116_Transcript_1_1_Confidence_1.000_Length_2762::g.81885::m.81885